MGVTIIITLMTFVIVYARKAKEVHMRQYIAVILVVMLQVAGMVLVLATKGLPPAMPK
jgi:heme/copper-type cytochrome/quinol oxidase subunit 4